MKPIVEVDLAERSALEHAGDRGQRGTEDERDDDDPVGVDAHQLRGVRVLRRGAHRPASAAARTNV